VRWCVIEYIYAALLLHAAKKEINEETLRRVLEAAGIAVDEVRLKSLVAAIKEINIDEVLKAAVAVPAAPVAVAAAPSVPAAPAEERKEEKKEEEKEEKKELSEEALAEGLAALFG